MSEVIVGRDQFFAAKKPKMFQVELPDMGVTVNVLKGTMSTLRAIDAVPKSPDGSHISAQVALILADENGELLLKSQEDIDRAAQIMSIGDIKCILDEFAKVNGISKQQLEAAIKNLQASPNGNSASA